MTDRAFRELIDEAVEQRRSLDTPRFRRLADGASEQDRGYWQRQALLDRTIVAWRGGARTPSSRRGESLTVIGAGVFVKAWRGVRQGQTAAALALGLSAVVIWSGWGEKPPEPVAITVPTDPVVAIEPGPVSPEPFDSRPVEPVRPEAGQIAAGGLTDGAGGAGGFTEATETAERLAYAFQPVGEHVGSVVRLLIDAVPGSDVFSM